MSINLRDVSDSKELAILEKENPEASTLLQIFPEEAAKLLINNKDKLQKISKYMSNVTTAVSANAMVKTCSSNCNFKDICILAKNEMAPVGYPCPVEKKIIMEMEADVIQHLDIDRSNPIEMELLWDLIDAKLLDMRASGKLKNGSLVQIVEQKVGQAVVSREEIDPTLEFKIELKKLKHSIIDAFIGTRRAKKKYGMSSDAGTLEAMLVEAAAKAGK